MIRSHEEAKSCASDLDLWAGKCRCDRTLWGGRRPPDVLVLIRDDGKRNTFTGNVPSDACVDITFNGSGNTVHFESANQIERVEIVCDGDGNTIRLGALRRVRNLRILAKNGGQVQIGGQTSIEQCYILADKQLVSVGRDCMVSFQVDIRTTDAHGIYDVTTGDLLNGPDDIVIDDHVWLAQGVIVPKGSRIGRNSIIGSRAYVQKCSIPPNSLAAGAPARVVKSNVIWDRRVTANIYAPEANFDPDLEEWMAPEGVQPHSTAWMSRLFSRGFK